MQRIDKDRDSASPGERRRAVKSPHPSLLALEPTRASMELFASVGVVPLLRYLPRGDGHPVLVLPAFGTSDGSTRGLRRRLRSIGNLDPTSTRRCRLRRGCCTGLSLSGVRDRIKIQVR